MPDLQRWHLRRYVGLPGQFLVDLDFNVVKEAAPIKLRNVFHQAFNLLGFAMTLEFDQALFFQLRFPNNRGKRSTLMVSASNLKVAVNQYRVQHPL